MAIYLEQAVNPRLQSPRAHDPRDIFGKCINVNGFTDFCAVTGMLKCALPLNGFLSADNRLRALALETIATKS
jgi:hypothetical protein